MMLGDDVPSLYSTDPANRQWLDSTRPIAASSAQGKPQPGSIISERPAALL